MTQDNVEILLDAFDAMARGEAEALVRVLDPDVEWSQMEEPGPAVGPEAVLEALGRWADMWEDLEVEVRERIAAGDQVVLLLHWSGRSKPNAVPVEQSAYNVFTMCDGKVRRMREYGSRAEALEAAGLAH